MLGNKMKEIDSCAQQQKRVKTKKFSEVKSKLVKNKKSYYNMEKNNNN